MRSSRLLSVLLLSALPLAVSAQQLTVSAAASLTDAFKEIGSKFEAAHQGDSVRFNFGASGALLQQIGQCAPADVFASADQATMDKAVSQSLIDKGTRRDFAANSLVLIVPATGGPTLSSVQDLMGESVKRIAVGKEASVPAGRYTREALESAKLWTALQPKIVQADNVRQALDYVSRGEVDAGFVYRTDAALLGDKVKIALTATGHTPVTYPVAVVSSTKQKALAQTFIDYLNAPEAQTILARYGFTKP
jgi:molybdate transport system substrate-binding protein